MKNIFTITKKELRTYFNHPTAYILMVVFLVIAYFFYFRPVLLTGDPTMRPMFDLLPWILLFFVPAVTMGLVAKERNDGTIETLATQPVKPGQIIIGKALGAFLFTFIAVLITLTIPLTLERFGSFDWGLIVSQYIGSIFLIAGFVSIGIWASSITKNQIVSFISSIAINFFLVFVGFEMVTLGLPYPLNITFKKISIMGHFYNVARGVIDLKDVIYFVCLVIIFLFLTYLAFVRIKGGKGREYKKFSSAIIIIVIAALIVNLSGNYVRGRVDLTSGRIFTLSKATKKIVANLDEDITINLFVSKQLPAQIESQAQDVKDLLDDYVARSNGKVKLNIYNPDTDNEAKSLAQTKGIPPIQFNVIAKDEFQAKQGYLGLTVEKEVLDEATIESEEGESSEPKTRTESELIPFIERTDNLEYQLTSFIWKLTKDETKKVAWLSGHEEKGLWTDFSAVNQELRKQYEVESLNLKETSAEEGADAETQEVTYKDVPEDISVLVIAGPSQSISEPELGKINHFLSQGGSALVLAKQLEVNSQFLTATGTDSNINLMLNEWGVNVKDALAYDLKSNESVTLTGGAVRYILPYPMWIRALATRENNILGDVKSIVLPWTSPIEILDDKLKEETKVTSLYNTTEFAGVQEKFFSINPQGSFSQENLKSRLLAVALENSLDDKVSRLIVVGNADFVTENFLPNAPENFAFILNAIEWLSQDETLASIRTKNLRGAPLVFKSDSEKNGVKYFNIIGVPVIVILVGAYVLMRRRKVSKRVFED